MIDGTALHRATNHFALYEMDAQAIWDYSETPNSCLYPALHAVWSQDRDQFITSVIYHSRDSSNQL